ncbi:hypothetical protein DFH09DRAFT_1102537 [Mycena vulgaris]|nr:hypothetical protein DFH09DRAFT_1102537 [Mycena vulgaris]
MSMSVSASSSSSPQRSTLLRALDRYQLPTPPASQQTITHGAVARALLSGEDRERLETLCLKPIPPAVAPRRRAGVGKQSKDAKPANVATDAATTVPPMAWKHDHTNPDLIFLDLSKSNFMWLGQNKIILGARGIEAPVALERYLNGRWEPLQWETRFKVNHGQAIIFRLKGVTQMDNFETTTSIDRAGPDAYKFEIHTELKCVYFMVMKGMRCGVSLSTEQIELRWAESSPLRATSQKEMAPGQQLVDDALDDAQRNWVQVYDTTRPTILSVLAAFREMNSVDFPHEIMLDEFALHVPCNVILAAFKEIDPADFCEPIQVTFSTVQIRPPHTTGFYPEDPYLQPPRGSLGPPIPLAQWPRGFRRLRYNLRKAISCSPHPHRRTRGTHRAGLDMYLQMRAEDRFNRGWNRFNGHVSSCQFVDEYVYHTLVRHNYLTLLAVDENFSLRAEDKSTHSFLPSFAVMSRTTSLAACPLILGRRTHPFAAYARLAINGGDGQEDDEIPELVQVDACSIVITVVDPQLLCPVLLS